MVDNCQEIAVEIDDSSEAVKHDQPSVCVTPPIPSKSGEGGILRWFAAHFICGIWIYRFFIGSVNLFKFFSAAIMPVGARSLVPAFYWSHDGSRYASESSTIMIAFFFISCTWERCGSVVECLTRDRGATGSSLTGVTVLWSLSKTNLS